MSKDHHRQLDKINHSNNFELNTSSTIDRDSDMESDDEWEDMMPKAEKIEEHFAYARAATSLRHVRRHLTSHLESLFFKCLAIRRTVGSCDKHTICLLGMKNLARYFSAYRYTQSLSLEGSNIFTIQEMATWFICASSIHSLQNKPRGVLGTDKKMNYNGLKDLKIQGLKILHSKSTSRNTTLFHRKWSLKHEIRLRPDGRRRSRWQPVDLNYIELLGKKMEGKGKDLEALFSILKGKTTPLRLHRRRKMPWGRR
ncbi:hypothetical protein FMEXI_2459 [Fusarium mexicanum]|uniref:Uncharacterized protein n=1 Tax=Fusarium mexicanum TaxID=751941 RepID=A0A8H5JFY5_9HYPO|nr:hypothetical protein FMEXI_2459 [Fusarium mexicanum]